MEDKKGTQKLIVEVNKNGEAVEMGVVVDSVSEVLDIKAEEIEATPEFGSGIDTKFILGMAKAKDGVKILLDIDKVLTSEDMGKLESISK